MRTTEYPAKRLLDMMSGCKVATLPQITESLGNPGRATVFRKLKELDYVASYSHGGMYYTLPRIARFDAQGLWAHEGIWFSRQGSLMRTVEDLVCGSEGGYFMRELDDILHVKTKKSLQRLLQQDRIGRERQMGWYLYCSPDAGERRKQVRNRRILENELILAHGLRLPQVSPVELKAATALVYSLLNERDRRLCAGLESLRYGFGGDRKVAQILGIDVHTVAKGRQELLEMDLDANRIRRQGAGRPSKKKPQG